MFRCVVVVPTATPSSPAGKAVIQVFGRSSQDRGVLADKVGVICAAQISSVAEYWVIKR